MVLTAEEIGSVRISYALIGQAPRDYSDLFYLRLLQRHPFTRALFPDDMTEQIEVFRKTVDALVERIDNPDTLQARLDGLARRHVDYGALPKHFALVGETLLRVFGELLEDRFTPAMRQAWHKLYDEVSTTMIRIAYNRMQDASPDPASPH